MTREDWRFISICILLVSIALAFLLVTAILLYYDDIGLLARFAGAIVLSVALARWLCTLEILLADKMHFQTVAIFGKFQNNITREVGWIAAVTG